MLDCLQNKSDITVVTAFSLTPKTVQFDIQMFHVDPKMCQAGLLFCTGKGSYDPHLKHPREPCYNVIHSKTQFTSHSGFLT